MFVRTLWFSAGTTELVSALHDHPGWANPATTWISGIYLKDVGFIIVGSSVTD